MAELWLRIEVVLTAGDGGPVVPSPGRVMVVPPSATLDEFGLAVDIAFGRWDTMRDRSFTRQTLARKSQRRRDRHLSPDAVLASVLSVGDHFVYVFDSDRGWTHECLVEEALEDDDTTDLAPIPVPLVGWGAIPDQDGRMTRDTSRPTSDLASLDRIEARRAADDGAEALLKAVDGKDLTGVLQQVGAALMRCYRTNRPLRKQLAVPLETVRTGLLERDWPGDDILATEIKALLTRTERRGRTLAVDLDDLAAVMHNAGEEPGGYLHLDTGEAIHASLRHGAHFWGDPAEEGQGPAEDDDLWLYIDNDSAAQWQDMADFAAQAGDHAMILSVAIRGSGAFRRFNTTVADLGLDGAWHAFSDERSWGRARAVLHNYGIRAV